MFVRDFEEFNKLFSISIILAIVTIIASIAYGCNTKDTELVRYSLVGKEIKREVIKDNISVIECERLTRKLCKEAQLHCENMKEE